MQLTQNYINGIAYKIVGGAIEVHRNLGPGLLESVYQQCFEFELVSRGLKFQSQVRLPVLYKGNDLGGHLMLDILVEDLVVVELKAVDAMIPLYEAQLLSYLKLRKNRRGY